MSKGSPIVSVRVPEEVLRRLKDLVSRARSGPTGDAKASLSDTIVSLLVDALNHKARGRDKTQGRLRVTKTDDAEPRSVEIYARKGVDAVADGPGARCDDAVT